ncbi:MAG: hypothetical protein IPM32_12380 [Ignavibacteriae bacterium]|nr:hypothetical protein [Ignavibacteriota bacterium]
MKKRIKILTGKIHSGKTTKLFSTLNTLKSVDGILAPVVNEKRMLYHIESKVMQRLEVDFEIEETIKIGKYLFLEKSFEWANKKIIEGYLKNPDWLIIDEIGKLEIMEKGLHKSFKFFLEDENNYKTKLIIVIRENLLENIIYNYKLDAHELKIYNLKEFSFAE